MSACLFRHVIYSQRWNLDTSRHSLPSSRPIPSQAEAARFSVLTQRGTLLGLPWPSIPRHRHFTQRRRVDGQAICWPPGYTCALCRTVHLLAPTVTPLLSELEDGRSGIQSPGQPTSLRLARPSILRHHHPPSKAAGWTARQTHLLANSILRHARPSIFRLPPPLLFPWSWKMDGRAILPACLINPMCTHAAVRDKCAMALITAGLFAGTSQRERLQSCGLASKIIHPDARSLNGSGTPSCYVLRLFYLPRHPGLPLQDGAPGRDENTEVQEPYAGALSPYRRILNHFRHIRKSSRFPNTSRWIRRGLLATTWHRYRHGA